MLRVHKNLRAAQVVCPHEVHELGAAPRPFERNGSKFDRVLLADYPSTGSTWLHRLLDATVADLDGVPPLGCSIYGEGGMVNSFGKVFCEQGWRPDAGAVLFKSHFPAQELYATSSLADWQYKASMAFDKLVLLLRHPISTVISNHERWREGSLQRTSTDLSCWASWWQRSMDAVGPSKVLVVRYEDLCLDTANVLQKVFHFLGGAYSNISKAHGEAALNKNPGLRCYYSPQELQGQAEARDTGISPRHILPYISNWFWQYNYTNASTPARPGLAATTWY